MAGPRYVVDALYMIAWFVALFGLGNVNIIISLRQMVTPPSMLGRMNAAARAVMSCSAWAPSAAR